jgi:hypothetical protein
MINFFALVCKKYHKFTKYGLILYLLDPKARAKRYGQFLLDFLKITNNGIVCLATFIDCHTSLICGEKTQRWQSVGRSGGPVLRCQAGKKKSL